MNRDSCTYMQKNCCPFVTEQYEKKKRRRGLRIIGGLLIFCFFCGIIVTVGSNETPDSDYIAVLDITGTISKNDGATYNQQYLLDSVDEFMNDRYNKGLILHIDSPGGAVYQIDELYQKLIEYKEITSRPVYAAIESYAASGGYYEACAADQIYANRNAITGSIGVIMGEFFDVSELLDHLGVDVTYITSGTNKAMGSSYQSMTEEQKLIYQSICDESYQRFVDIIANSRNMEELAVRKLADGRIYTATQALNNGLIDGIESFEDTQERMTHDLGYETIDIWTYSYQAPAGLWDYLVNGNIQQLVNIITGNHNLKLLENEEIPQVMMYFTGY